MSEFPEDEFELEMVMPFVCVQSKDGPYEDLAFCAGYQMGLLDAALTEGHSPVIAVIYAEAAQQADLIAMRHGYRLTSTEVEDLPEWVELKAVRV